MKKKLLISIIILFTILFPAIAKAEGIENFLINATIESNGDLVVEEYFNLTGSYNGFDRIIYYANSNLYPFDSSLNYYGASTLNNGDNIILESIKAVEVNSNFDFNNVVGKEFKESNKADIGDYGVYTKYELSKGEKYRIFLPSKKKQAFYLKYRITNIALLHNDVGEIYWNIFSNELVEDIENLKVVLNIPNNQNIRVWAHGPLHGEVKKDGETKLVATISNLDSKTAIDIRATFDKDVIANSTKKTNVEALSKIINYEEDKANQANYERDQLAKKAELEAIKVLDKLKEDLTFDNYNKALSSIEKIKDEEIRTKYLKELENLYPAVVKNMEKEAQNKVDTAEYMLRYDFYDNALNLVEQLPNSELKISLLKRLDSVKEIIIKEENNLNLGISIIIIFLVLINIIITYIIYIKCSRKKEVEFKEKYLRNIPENSTPSSVSYLLTKKITSNAISAEILNMINKKIILYEKIDNKNYKLILNDNNKELTYKERLLIDTIFDSKSELTLKEIKQNSKKSYRSMYNNYNRFITSATNEGKSKNYYEAKTKHGSKIYILIIISLFITIIEPIIGIPVCLFLIIRNLLKDKKSIDIKNLFIIFISFSILLSLGLILYILLDAHFINYSWIFSFINIMLDIILIIVLANMKRLTLEGANERAKWQAIKRFLKDFSRFDEKELPEVSLWSNYLVFATTLGCAKKVEKVMRLKLENMTDIDKQFDITDIYQIYRINKVISNSVIDSAHIASRNYSASTYSSGSGSYSSGSGGGGGFSSGGGSGGGGGGGGRF